eukprot:SAG31_NODE_129_length_23447_cov_5.010922_4_plen_209_part_00
MSTLKERITIFQAGSTESDFNARIGDKRLGHAQQRQICICYDAWCSLTQQRRRRRQRAVAAGERIQNRHERYKTMRQLRVCWLGWMYCAQNEKLQQKMLGLDKQVRNGRHEIQKLRSASAAAIKQAEASRQRVHDIKTQAQQSVLRERQMAKEQIAAAQQDAEAAAARLGRVKKLADDAVDAAWHAADRRISKLRYEHKFTVCQLIFC